MTTTVTDQETYLREDAFEETLKYFNGDELATSVFIDKYALKNKQQKLLEKTPDDTHRRLAREFARIEKNYPNPMDEDEIFELFRNFDHIVAQGSPMSAIGNPYQYISAGNCFVLESPYDSYSGILYTDTQQVSLMKRRCGVGFDISNIRPKDVPVQNAAKTTDGIGLFMERYSRTTREVAQKGRRGASLLSCSVEHPEIETFINIKRNLDKVTGCNISVRLRDEFMKAVMEDGEFVQQWPIESKSPSITRRVKAKEIWDQIIDSAWASGEPGVMFWDTMNIYSPAHLYGSVDKAFYNRSTNPCGEVVQGTDSCRLMLLNLFSFVENAFKDNAYFNFEKLAIYAQKAQRLMDDLVDIEIELIQRIIDKVESDPEPEHIKRIEIDMWTEFLRVCKLGRRTGLGVTGLGDALAAMGIHYGNTESIEITESIYRTICLNAYRASCMMAKERGAFGIYDYDLEKDNPYLRRIFDADPEIEKLHKKYGRRNVALLTTAPAGSVSLLTQTTSGIEPVYLLEYKRRKKINSDDKDSRVDFIDNVGDCWQEYIVYHHKFNKWMEVTGKSDVKESPYYKATSNDINWIQSIEMQAAAQKWICHSISKTVNVPNDTPKETIDAIYRHAWKKGCKGLTVYRDGCRTGVLVSDKKTEKPVAKIPKTDAPKRPESLPAEIHHFTSKNIRYYVAVGLYEGEPYEVFTGLNHDKEGDIVIPKYVKEGNIQKIKRGQYRLNHLNKNEEIEEFALTNGHSDDNADALTRAISLSLRHGADISYIVHQLEKTKGDMVSFTKVLGRSLKKYIVDGSKISGEDCPKCAEQGVKNSLIRQDGCCSCSSCGWTKC